MAERGRGRGGGRGGRRGGGGGGASSAMNLMAQRLGTTALALRQMKTQFDPEPMFPNFLVPRPTKLTLEEAAVVRYYKSLRNRIVEETPFYVTGMKRPAVDDEDDGIVLLCPCSCCCCLGWGVEEGVGGWLAKRLMVGVVRYRDKYKPAKAHRQTLRGLPTGILPLLKKYTNSHRGSILS